MKLPINVIARFALKIGVRALAKAAADPAKPITAQTAKDALVEQLEAAALRAAIKAAG